MSFLHSKSIKTCFGVFTTLALKNSLVTPNCVETHVVTQTNDVPGPSISGTRITFSNPCHSSNLFSVILNYTSSMLVVGAELTGGGQTAGTLCRTVALCKETELSILICPTCRSSEITCQHSKIVSRVVLMKSGIQMPSPWRYSQESGCCFTVYGF